VVDDESGESMEPNASVRFDPPVRRPTYECCSFTCIKDKARVQGGGIVFAVKAAAAAAAAAASVHRFITATVGHKRARGYPVT